MNSISTDGLRCVVHGEEKLPAEIGGEPAICAAIADAALPALRRAGISPQSIAVTVTIGSPFLMSAVASVDDRTLPEQKVGISDRQLNALAVQMLADAVARELANLR